MKWHRASEEFPDDSGIPSQIIVYAESLRAYGFASYFGPRPGRPEGRWLVDGRQAHGKTNRILEEAITHWAYLPKPPRRRGGGA